MPGEVIEEMRHLAGGALIDARLTMRAIWHHHRQSAVPRKMREVERPMTGIIDFDPRGDVIVPGHASVAR